MTTQCSEYRRCRNRFQKNLFWRIRGTRGVTKRAKKNQGHGTPSCYGMLGGDSGSALVGTFACLRPIIPAVCSDPSHSLRCPPLLCRCLLLCARCPAQCPGSLSKLSHKSHPAPLLFAPLCITAPRTPPQSHRFAVASPASTAQSSPQSSLLYTMTAIVSPQPRRGSFNPPPAVERPAPLLSPPIYPSNDISRVSRVHLAFFALSDALL